MPIIIWKELYNFSYPDYAALDTSEAAANVLIATEVASQTFLKANSAHLCRPSLMLPCPSYDNNPKD